MSLSRQNDDRLRVAIAEHAGDLLTYLERRVEPPADAADVLSDALLNAWRKRRTLPGDDAAARPWLFVFARNAMLNHHRTARRRTAALDALRDYLVAQHRAAPMTTDDALAVRTAVTKLPDRERELIELVHWDGFSITDAATILGIPASTARTRHSTARSRLRRELTETPATEPQR